MPRFACPIDCCNCDPFTTILQLLHIAETAMIWNWVSYNYVLLLKSFFFFLQVEAEYTRDVASFSVVSNETTRTTEVFSPPGYLSVCTIPQQKSFQKQ